MLSITELVKDTQAEFVCYRDGDLWYRIVRPLPVESSFSLVEVENLFEFPIPVSDTGTGIFQANEKAIRLMRWIRKWREKMIESESHA